MDKIKIKYFPIKIIIIFIILICYFKIKTKNKFINIENYYLIKSIYNITKINLYINYLNNFKIIQRINNESFLKKENPFLSICISTYNSEKYIEKAILSIINQSFQDFEIIVVNDNSIDNTSEILMKLQKMDTRIKLINHSQNLNSKSKYILFLDSDDMIFNPFLFENIYECYLKHNLDIIEYTVFYKLEEENKLYYPPDHELNHYHNYSKNIICQPELSNILFFIPNTKVFNFAQNYTNLNIPGYLYNVRKSSITHKEEDSNSLIQKSISFFLYYFIFHRYIKEFDKDRNYLYYDLKEYGEYILNLTKYNNTEYYLKKVKIMLNDILNDNNATLEFKNYIKCFYKAILK